MIGGQLIDIAIKGFQLGSLDVDRIDEQPHGAVFEALEIHVFSQQLPYWRRIVKAGLPVRQIAGRQSRPQPAWAKKPGVTESQ